MDNLGIFEWFCIGMALLPAVFWVIALVDIVRSSFQESTNKIVWVLVITFVPVIGVILYYAIGTKQKIFGSGESTGAVPNRPFSGSDKSETFPAKSTIQQGRLCPKCNILMDVRTVDQGKYRGQRFYVCPNYKQCHQVFPIKE